jgi:glycosyltransferase involved in cell wall biosynthesis
LLIADSLAIGALWAQEFAVPSVFIPYGAEVVASSAADRLESLNLEPRGYVLIVARLIPENNIDLILTSLAMMSPPQRAVVVGAAPPGASLEHRLRDFERRGVVQLLGHIDDQSLLMQLWANAGVYVHGHSVGGTNPGLLQALGAGAPTIALDTAFNREVIGEDEQLFVGQPSVLARKIAQVLSSPSIQQRFAAHGKAVVSERYRWPDVSQRYLDAMLEARRRRRSHGR